MVGWQEVDRVTIIDRKRRVTPNEATALFSFTIPNQSGSWTREQDHTVMQEDTRLEPAGTRDLILTLRPSCVPLSQESHLSNSQADCMSSWDKLEKGEKLTACLFLLKNGHLNLQW